MARKSSAPISMDIGISDKDRAAIAKGLSRLLADTYTLYLKTHNFHWNVTGPMFQTLHLMFEAEVAKLLGIPASVTQTALFPVAYYTGDDFKPATRKPAGDFLHWDAWGTHRG